MTSVQLKITHMKNKYFLAAAISIFASASVFAQWKHVDGSGNVVTQTRSVDAFDEIGVAGGMSVSITPSSTISVKVETDDNLQEYILTEVSGGKLNLKYKNNVSISGKGVKVYITMPKLNAASISGSGNIVSQQVIPADGNFDAAISGSGNIKIQTSATNVKGRISGSGSIEMGGKTNGLDVVISGSGSFKGYQLAAKDASVKISGSGDVETTVNGKLDAVISGSGSVFYKGIADISMKSSGSGKIKKTD